MTAMIMRLCRFTHASFPAPRYGLIEGEAVFPLAAQDIAALTNEPQREGEPLPLITVRLLPPVTPTKIVCVGRNYQDHAAELGNPMPAEPLLFLKPPSALIGHEDAIELPAASARVEHEGELAVVIGRSCRRLSDADDPLAYALGYTCLNDVTARDLQRKDVQFTRGKSFDTFCPVGPYVVTGLDPGDMEVATRVNGVTRQRGRTSAMAFPVPYLLRYISRIMTLVPGDIIATGTPAGVGPLAHGDIVEVQVEGVGTLRNHVIGQTGSRQ